MTRALLAVLLTLTLAWGSVQQAVAHGQMADAMEVVICGADGQISGISLDAGGDPKAPHPCAPCLAATPLDLLPDPTQPRRNLTLARGAGPVLAEHQARRDATLRRSLARAPPSQV